MTVLRVYDPGECRGGVPLDWERCRACAPSIDVPLMPGPYNGPKPSAERDPQCRVCNGHGSLKAAALAGRVEGIPNFADLMVALRAGTEVPIRCEDCGHPASEGTWEGAGNERHPQAAGVATGDALRSLRAGVEPRASLRRDWGVYYSPCDEGCRHGGPVRARSLSQDDEWCYFDGPAVPRGAEASWRSVDVRTLGGPYDLRPEKLAVLCLRCFAGRPA